MQRWVDRLTDPLRSRFERLNAREQAIVSGGGAAAVLLVLLLIGSFLSSSISSVQRRISSKSSQLAEVVQLESEYKAREAERTQRLAELERSNVRLVTVIEKAAQTAGFEIGQIRPEEGEPNDEGVVESRVDLRASDLTINRLERFLTEIEKTPGLVIVRRLQIDKPYRKDTLNIEMTVATYKIEKS